MSDQELLHSAERVKEHYKQGDAGGAYTEVLNELNRIEFSTSLWAFQ